jgi:hypothetical protein
MTRFRVCNELWGFEWGGKPCVNGTDLIFAISMARLGTEFLHHGRVVQRKNTDFTRQRSGYHNSPRLPTTLVINFIHTHITGMNEIDIDILRQLIRLDPETGDLYWLHRDEKFFADGKQSAAHNASVWNTRRAGKLIGPTKNKQGYQVVKIFRKTYQQHRVMFALYHDRWPSNGLQLDHIDGDKINNHPDNLREVTNMVNQQNTKMHSHNTSGVNGVNWMKLKNKWRAEIRIDGKSHYLGVFDTIEEAAEARRLANIKYGFTARHGT